MNNTITIEPVTRLEGKARITIEQDDSGKVTKAEFNVLEFRAFEKFLEGRMAREMPRITQRICGICPVSHHLVSAKATDMLARTIIPKRAVLHRELMHLAQFIHSHVLHIYFLAMPDFIDGFKSESNDFRLLLAKDPDMLKKVIRLRKYGQDIINITGGKAIHPMSAIPGGISKPISQENQEELLTEGKELIPIAKEILDKAWSLLDAVPDELKRYETLESHNMGLVNADGSISLYDGEVVIINNKGDKMASFRGAAYLKNIEEKIQDWSWTKFPYYKKATDADAILQVGPLARQKIYDSIPTPIASEMLEKFRNQFGRYTNEAYHTHYARLLEVMYSLEKCVLILENPKLLKGKYRIKNVIGKATGVGILEAPRGTLIHHFESNDEGRIRRSNIIVATTFNNPAINMTLLKVARAQLDGKSSIGNETLRYIESSVRVYDPCLTCSSHSMNNFSVELIRENGECIDHVAEGSRSLII